MLVSRSFESILAFAVGAGGVLVACGGDGNKPTDARTDGPPADANCTNYQGEIIDWNATTTTFCGVKDAVATVHGQTAPSSTAAPNGRFTLCLAPSQNSITVDIAPSKAKSECLVGDATAYNTGGTLTLQSSLISSGQLASVRLMTDMELMTEFAAVGQPYQTDHGQLLVHIIGTPSRLAFMTGSEIIQANCGMERQFNGSIWEPVMGSLTAGTDVFFADCSLKQDQSTQKPVASRVTLKLANAAASTVDVTVEPGQFTYVTMVSP